MRALRATLLYGVLLSSLTCSARFKFDDGAGGSAGSSSGGSASATSGHGGALASSDSGGIDSGDADGDAFDTCTQYCQSFGLSCAASTLTCVECLGDADCAGDQPHCSLSGSTAQRCVECLADMDCGASARCALSLHVCVPSCVASTTFDVTLCSALGPRPFCDSDHGSCGGCRDEDDCDQTDTPHCIQHVGCRECSSDRDCGDAPGSYCDPVLFRCVECRDSSDCLSGACDPNAHTCL